MIMLFPFHGQLVMHELVTYSQQQGIQVVLCIGLLLWNIKSVDV